MWAILPAAFCLSLHHPLTCRAQQVDSGFIALKTEVARHNQNQDPAAEARSLQKMGDLMYHNGNYLQAMDYLLQADKMLRDIRHPALLATNLNLLGRVYYYNQQPDNALALYREALGIFKKQQDRKGMAETYGFIGHMYEKQLNYDSAFYYQKIALDQALASGNSQAMAAIYENIGSIFEDRAMYDSARKYFLESLRLYESLDMVESQIPVLNNLGDVWSKTGRYSEGMPYAQKAAAMATASGEKYQLQSAYRDIAQNFAGLGQFDSAYTYLEKSRHLIQSIYAIENSRQIGLMQTLYDTEKKNAEITRLNASRKVNRIQNLTIITALVLLTLLAFVLVSRQKMKVKKERAIHESNKKVFETQKGLMESELKRKQMEEDSLIQQLETKSRQLSSHILHLIQKNEVMDELKQGLLDISKDDKRDHKKQVRQLLQKINMSFSQDSYWDEFRLIFDQVHPSFLPNLQKLSLNLTPREVRLLSLLKMNLQYEDMATLLGITTDSLRVLRYRLKKKLNLGPEDSLSGFAQSV